MSLRPTRPSTKGSPLQLAMALCDAPHDDSASSFNTTPTVSSRPGISSALAGLALGHKPHAQRQPSLDQMGVPRLHLPMAPGIHNVLALAGLALGMYVRHNFLSRGAITASRPRVPASVILARPHPSQQTVYLPCSRWYVPSLRYTHGLGWRMHCGAEVTESSTNKQHNLST